MASCLPMIATRKTWSESVPAGGLREVVLQVLQVDIVTQLDLVYTPALCDDASS